MIICVSSYQILPDYECIYDLAPYHIEMLDQPCITFVCTIYVCCICIYRYVYMLCVYIYNYIYIMYVIYIYIILIQDMNSL